MIGSFVFSGYMLYALFFDMEVLLHFLLVALSCGILFVIGFILMLYGSDLKIKADRKKRLG